MQSNISFQEFSQRKVLYWKIPEQNLHKKFILSSRSSELTWCCFTNTYSTDAKLADMDISCASTELTTKIPSELLIMQF